MYFGPLHFANHLRKYFTIFAIANFARCNGPFTDGSFLFFYKTLVSLFLHFLNLGARVPKIGIPTSSQLWMSPWSHIMILLYVSLLLKTCIASIKQINEILLILKNQLKMIRHLENKLSKQQNGNKQLCDNINIIQVKIVALKLKAENKRNIKMLILHEFHFSQLV